MSAMLAVLGTSVAAGAADSPSESSTSWKSSATTTADQNIVTLNGIVAGPGAGKRYLDVEIYDGSVRVAQVYRLLTMDGSSKRFTASIDLNKRAGHTLVAKVGVFTETWTLEHWNDNLAVLASSNLALPTTTPPTSASSPTTAPTTNPGNPLSGVNFFADPRIQALNVSAQLRAQGRTADAATIESIGKTPNARWFGSSSSVKSEVASTVALARSQDQLPVLVAYNIPGRDCGSYSAGGASGMDAYRAWIADFAAGIGSAKVAVIVEPDALPGLDCLSAQGQADRYTLLNYAVQVLTANANTVVYLDAGGYGWQSTAVMADRLTKAGVAKARGFSLNVSGFGATNLNTTYGDDLAAKLGGKHFVIDTSRNGNGSNGEWCNPGGRKLGVVSTAVTGHANTDAFLWVKGPGESDGTCNGGPSAGQFWTDYALGLARN